MDLPIPDYPPSIIPTDNLIRQNGLLEVGFHAIVSKRSAICMASSYQAYPYSTADMDKRCGMNGQCLSPDGSKASAQCQIACAHYLPQRRFYQTGAFVVRASCISCLCRFSVSYAFPCGTSGRNSWSRRSPLAERPPARESGCPKEVLSPAQAALYRCSRQPLCRLLP